MQCESQTGASPGWWPSGPRVTIAMCRVQRPSISRSVNEPLDRLMVALAVSCARRNSTASLRKPWCSRRSATCVAGRVGDLVRPADLLHVFGFERTAGARVQFGGVEPARRSARWCDRLPGGGSARPPGPGCGWPPGGSLAAGQGAARGACPLAPSCVRSSVPAAVAPHWPPAPPRRCDATANRAFAVIDDGSS